MRDIENLTEKELFDICNIAVGGKLHSRWVWDISEVETGGYGKRRQVEFKITEPDKEPETHYFEISAEAKNRGWHWYSWCIDTDKVVHNVHCLNAPAIVDYCDKNNIDIRNLHWK